MIRETLSDKWFDAINKLLIGLVLIAVLYPLVYVVSASISDPIEVNAGRVWLFPKQVTLEGYSRILVNPEIWSGYRNTVLYTLAGVMINLAVTLPCAYALARRGLPGKHYVMILLMITMFFNGGLIPTFLLVKQLGMVNTVWAILLLNAATVWNIVVARTYFQSTIPAELEEQAEMDGCSYFRLFWQIVLPLSKPIVAVMALFYGVGHWNQYFNAMIYLSDRELFPLQLILREILVLQEMRGSILLEGESYEDIMAVNQQMKIADLVKYSVMIVSVLPMLIAYPFLQRYFVKGVMIGSLKG